MGTYNGHRPGKNKSDATVINGTKRDDWIHGTDFNDTIDGRDGNDTIMGGHGDDLIFGGSGNDSLNGDSSAGWGSGNDTLVGGSGDDNLGGGEGDDILYGDGQDWTLPEGGNDFLAGGTGDDTLYGGGGNDELYSGTGADFHHGGSGQDLFTYGWLDGSRGADGIDTIADFTPGEDQLLVALWQSNEANTAVEGLQGWQYTASGFVDWANWDSANGQLTLEYVGSGDSASTVLRLYNNDGDSQADFELILLGDHFTAADLSQTPITTDYIGFIWD